MTSVQSVSPTVTVLVSSKPTPLMVTVAPPAVPTLDGDTALTERTTYTAQPAIIHNDVTAARNWNSFAKLLSIQ